MESCVSIFEQNEFAKRAKITMLVALALLFAVERVGRLCRFPTDEPASGMWKGNNRKERRQHEKYLTSSFATRYLCLRLGRDTIM